MKKKTNLIFAIIFSLIVLTGCQNVKQNKSTNKLRFKAEEVTFVNSIDNVTLSGTLTTPEHGSNFPAVILIHGSGHADRDETIGKNKVFKAIAEYLSEHGIAVLRYDKRGCGKSTGDYSTSNLNQYASDIIAAINYLKNRKDIDNKNIGLIGHSEGGMVGPMVAAKDQDVAFLVIMGGLGIAWNKAIEHQIIYQAENNHPKPSKKAIGFLKAILKKSYEILRNDNYNSNELKTKLTALINQEEAKFKLSKKDINILKSLGFTKDHLLHIFIFHYRTSGKMYYNPSETLKEVKCPILALNGSLDNQVLPRENLQAIKEALDSGGNKDHTIIEVSGVNHVFQDCKTGFEDYTTINQNISTRVLKLITNWILETTNK